MNSDLIKKSNHFDYSLASSIQLLSLELLNEIKKIWYYSNNYIYLRPENREEPAEVGGLSVNCNFNPN